MQDPASVLLVALGLIVLLGFGWFGLVSRAEGERRATRLAFAAAVAGSAVLFGLGALPAPIPAAVLGAVVLGLMALAALAIAVELTLRNRRSEIGPSVPRSRFDERDVMFARARLEPGSPEFEAYYEMRPENRKPDEITRRMPGLLSPGTRYEDARLFASAKASFGLTEALRDAVDGRVTGMADDGAVAAEARQATEAAQAQAAVPRSAEVAQALVDQKRSSAAMSPGAATDYVKALASYYGAQDVGITELRPYHVYSHVGRGRGEYGAPIEVEHRFAIAFTVEMAFDMVGAAPHAPTVIESARQYVESARVAVQLAGAIRALGWPARAHIDGNYRVIAPLVARDAGLGEIGRMGLLMTPREGPRVRLGVVTTDLELVAHAYEPDAAVIDFCAICRKCAECCPSRSIPLGDREEIDGALRWRIDPDTCYRYWNVIGTDCARCMAVCPFSHPDTLAHNLIRWGIARSAAVRRAALKMDDAFYGRKPESREPPAWTDFGERG